MSMRKVHPWRLAALLMVLVWAWSAPLHAQDQAACDELARQLDEVHQRLDTPKAQAQAVLMNAAQLGALAPIDFAVAVQNRVPGISPQEAETYGGIAAGVGADIDAWRSANEATASDAYLRDLPDQVQRWQETLLLIPPLPVNTASITGLKATLSGIEQLFASAAGELALLDALNAQMASCGE